MENNINLGSSMETTHTIDVSDKLYKIILIIMGLAAILGVSYLWQQSRALPQNAPHEISVNGEGRAFAKPDVAIISFGVTVQATKSQDAVNQSNEKMNAVIKAVKDLGVKDEDIQTNLYSLNPIYGPSERLPLGIASYPYPINNKITGYSLNQQVQVKIRNFDNINSIIDKATASGSNTVGQLNFTVDDMEKVMAEARNKAIAKAKEKAISLASQAGLNLDGVVNINEGYGYPVPYGVGGALALEKSVASDIQVGQLEVNTTVTLTYRVK
jgi:uncharacterized protein